MFFCCISVWHVGKWLSSKSDMEYGVRVKLSSRFPVDCAYFLNPVFDRNVLFNEKWTSTGHAGWDLQCSSARPRRCCKCMILKQALWCISFAMGPNRCFHSAVWLYLVNCWEILHGSVGLSQRECDMPRSFALPLPCFFFNFKLGHRPPTSTMFAVRVINLQTRSKT